MNHLLDRLFYFPPDPLADQQFVQRILDLLRVPVLVVDPKVRPRLVNAKYDTDIAMYTARLSSATRKKHMKIFSALIEPHVVSCLEHGQVELLPGVKLPVSKEIEVDVAICPGQIQGSELAFVIGLAPQPAGQLSKDTVLRTVIESTDAVVVVFDTLVRMGMLNRGACEAFRQREEDLVGKRISEVNPSEQAKVLERQITYFLTSHKVSVEGTYPLASAKRGVIQMRLAAWPMVDGDVSSGVVVVGEPLPTQAVTAPEGDWSLILGKTVDELGPASFFTHVDGRVVFMTRKAQAFVAGLTDRKQINIIEDLPWSDPQAIKDLYEALSRGTGFSTLLAGAETPAGIKRFRIMAYALRDVGDIVSQVFLVIHDVSEIETYRKLMAETTKNLATEKDMLERTVELLDMPLALVDSDLVVRRINRALARRVHIAPETAVGMRLGEIVATLDQTGAADYIKQSLDQGKEIHLPRFEHITRDGVVTPMEGHLYPVMVEGKRGCLVIVKELVEKERLENEAARWAQLYEAVASSTRDGVVVHDKKGLLVDFNPTIAKVFGDKAKYVGRPARELRTIESSHQLDLAADKAVATGKPVTSGMVKLKRETTGEPVFMEVSFVPLAGRDGGYDGLVSVINYSTVAKNLEEQLKTYTKNLQTLVKERTRELSSANTSLGRSVERISSVARSGMVLSSLKDSRAVFDTFLSQVREILGADFASLAIAERSAGSAGAAYHTSGKPPPPGAIPSGVVERMTAQSVLGARAADGVRPDDPRVLTVDIDLADARGLMLAWRREGEFDPMDAVLARLLATQLTFALRVTAYVSDQRRERDRSDCLRRIAVRVAGALSVGDALRIVAEELARVVPADRFLWLVRSSGDRVWLSEVYARRGPADSVARHASLGSLGDVDAVFQAGKGRFWSLCQSSGGSAAGDPEPVKKAAARQACPFGCEAENGKIKQAVREFLTTAGLAPAGDGSFIVAPVMLAEGSWGLMCAHVEHRTATSCRDACFMCLAASTVGYVWQAADAASALRTLEVAGETVGDLAHDLKYPLMRITDSLAGLVALDRAKAADSAPVERIRDEVAKLTALTRELTEVSNPGSRKPEIVDLKEVVDSCMALVSSDVAARSITIRNDVAQAPPVFADRRDIVKITLGILANSVDALGGSGTITVASRLGEAQPGGRQVGLVFEDSGPGVAAGDIDKVFSAFYTTKQGGSGLGLFSAKKRARANGGDIICEMDERGKSRFVVMLPVAAA